MFVTSLKAVLFRGQLPFRVEKSITADIHFLPAYAEELDRSQFSQARVCKVRTEPKG